MSNSINKKFPTVKVLPLLILNILLILFAIAYAIFAILGKIEARWFIFFSWLGVLNLFNALFLYTLYINRDKLSFKIKSLSVLWGGFSLWYWIFAPIYWFFNMQPDNLQLAWAMFAHFWEVPVIGGILFVLGGYILLRKISLYNEGKYHPKDPEAFYLKVLRYPIKISIWLFIVVLISYAISTMQLAYFAYLPGIEQIKNIINGIASSVFLGALYYLFFERFLTQTRGRLESEFKIKFPTIHSFRARILNITLLALIGGLLLFSLIGFKYFQDAGKREAVEMLSTETYIFDIKPESIVLQSGEALPSNQFSPETNRIISREEMGALQDTRGELKSLYFNKNNITGETIVTYVDMAEVYEQILLPYKDAKYLFLGLISITILILISVITTIRLSIYSISKLSDNIRLATYDKSVKDVSIHTGDEIEQLSHEFTRYISKTRDLQENLEAKIAKSTKILNEAQRISHIGSWEWDIKNDVITWSEGLYRIYELNPKDFIPTYTGFIEKVHPDDRKRVDKIVQNSYVTGKSFDFLYRIIDQYGKVKILRAIGRVIMGEDGKPIRLTGTAQDVTEIETTKRELIQQNKDLKLINKDLNESRAAVLNIMEDLDEAKENVINTNIRIKSVIASIGEGIISTDKDGLVDNLNNKAIDLLGMDSEEIINKSIFDFLRLFYVDDKKVPDSENPIKIAFKSNETISSSSVLEPFKVLYIQHSDSSKIPVQIIVTPIISEAKIVGVVGVFRDLSEEIKVEHAKTEFVSIASHQLRTPLTTVNWYSEMLLSGDAGELTKSQKNYIEEVHKGNQRMIDLVNALLNVSRLEVGVFAVNSKMLDLVKIAHETVSEIEPQARQKAINIKEEYDKDIPKVKADKALVSIIMQNLISNAVKYTPAGGKVSVSLEFQEDVVVDQKKGREKGGVLIKVQDTGIGIPEEQSQKIFSKLFRADNAREIDAEGTGLGLFIIKSILDQTSGRIWFDSKKDKGSTFYILVPIKWMKNKIGTRTLSVK